MGEPGCSCPLCIWVQHQHRTQEGLAPLLSDSRLLTQEALLEAAYWEGRPAGPLSVPHTQAPEQGWVVHMLFMFILDPAVHVSAHAYLCLSADKFQTRKPPHADGLRKAVKWP